MAMSDGGGTMSSSAEHAAGAPADLAQAGWRKSSWSAYNGNCVEVAELRGGLIAVRDTKNRRGPVLVVGRAAWASFLAEVKAGPPGA